MYNQTLNRDRRKDICRYCFQSVCTAQILERHVMIFFKINGKQIIEMAKKSEAVKFKNYTRKIKSPFMIYADFESNLLPKNNGKQNPYESYTNKY